MPRSSTQEIEVVRSIFSGGVYSNVSQVSMGHGSGSRMIRFDRRLASVKAANNLVFRPFREIAARPGFMDTSTSRLTQPPNTLAKFYYPGGNKLFAFCTDGSVVRHTPSADVAQVLPWVATALQWRTEMANGLLVACQMGGVQSPIFYGIGNAAETWLSMVLPKPTPEFSVALCNGTNGTANVSTTTAAGFANVKVGMAVYGSVNVPADTVVLTWTDSTHIVLSKNITPANLVNVTLSFAQRPTFGADIAGGSMTENKPYFYRVRWRYANGSSRCSTASAGHTMVNLSGNDTASVNIPRPTDGGGVARADYVGWTLERTQQNGTALGPFYTVADGTAATYSDANSDASLFNEADETQHGEPVPMDGVIFHKGRLFGWYGSNLYVSQIAVGAPEGTGICNWVGDFIYPLDANDGDSIQTCVIQNDRLVAFKRSSTWTLDGDDEFSFRLSKRDTSVGCCGPRAAAAVGHIVFFAGGNGRLFMLRGNAIEPLAVTEMGDYLATMDTGQDSKILAVNVAGDYVLFWYTAIGNTVSSDVLAFDLRASNWTHWNGIPASDAIYQRDGVDFSNATLLIADPTSTASGANLPVNTNPSFVGWGDQRAATTQGYVQKLNSLGVPQWAANGVPVSLATANAPPTPVPSVCSDPSGAGCAVAWNDYRGSTIETFATRLDATGATVAGWPVAVSTAGGTSDCYPLICSDGVSYFVAFVNQNATGITVQKYNAAGVAQWAAGGVSLGNGSVLAPSWFVPDGSGGVYVAFVGATRLTRIDSTGAFVAGWASGGLFLGGNSSWSGSPIPNSSFSAVAPLFAIASDGFVWVARCTAAGQIVMSRVSAAGVLTSSGNLTPAASFTGSGTICADNLGGAFMLWSDQQAGASAIRMNRCTPAGVKAWAADVVLSAIPTYSNTNALWLIKDGSGGAIAIYSDAAAGAGAASLYATRITVDGLVLWTTKIDAGLTVLFGVTASTDGSGGAVVYYQTGSGITADIRGQRVRNDGALLWGAGGVSVCAATGLQSPAFSAFTNAPTGDLPSTTPKYGYHIWSGLKGRTDRADVNGFGGNAIAGYLKSHRDDANMPNYDKDYDWFGLYVESGSADFTVIITPDRGGDPVTISFSAATSGAEYDVDSYDDPLAVYADEGRRPIGQQLPKGTVGRAMTLELAFNSNDGVVLGGWESHAWALPRKDHP